jgi:hypothetical protein
MPAQASVGDRHLAHTRSTELPLDRHRVDPSTGRIRQDDARDDARRLTSQKSKAIVVVALGPHAAEEAARAEVSVARR